LVVAEEDVIELKERLRAIGVVVRGE